MIGMAHALQLYANFNAVASLVLLLALLIACWPRSVYCSTLSEHPSIPFHNFLDCLHFQHPNPMLVSGTSFVMHLLLFCLQGKGWEN